MRDYSDSLVGIAPLPYPSADSTVLDRPHGAREHRDPKSVRRFRTGFLVTKHIREDFFHLLAVLVPGIAQ